MKICIVYYSKTGNTRYVAQIIGNRLRKEKIDVDVIEIEPMKTPGFLKAGYAGGKQKELPIKNQETDLSKYDIILAGAPVWNGKPSPFIKTFLSKAKNIKGKKGTFFVTHAAPPGKNHQVLGVFRTNMENEGLEVLDPWLGLQMKKGRIESAEDDIDDFLKAIFEEIKIH